MLLMFQWPVLISIIFLFAFGVWASVQADVVKQTLETQWEDIRKFLPTTFEGRYDKVLFGEFLGKCEYMNNFLAPFLLFLDYSILMITLKSYIYIITLVRDTLFFFFYSFFYSFSLFLKRK